MNIHLDYETRSRADLQDVGAYRYANDPSTEILCAAIAEGDNEPVIWRCDQAMTQEVIDLLLLMTRNPNALVYAHNAQFEAAISDALFRKTFGISPPAHSKWRCTAAMGRRAALPTSLKNLAEFLQLKNQKDSKGMELIRKFSIPQKSTGEFIQPEDDPEAFQQFCDYCLQDVRVEQEIHKKIGFFSSKSAEQVFALDMAINSRGFPVNLDALRKADILVDTETERLGKIFTELTGLKHTQRERFMGWLKERGFKPDNLQSATLDEVLADEAFEEDTELGKALKIKKLITFASLAKIKSMLACAGPHDNRVRGTLTYHGAGTGRWSASLVQPQNFKRPAAFMESLSEQAYKDICDGCSSEWLELAYGPPLEVISSCIRHFIQHDSPMLDVDYSSIEARIIAWQAGEQWRLDVFNTHGRIYEASASTMFNVPLSEFEEYRKKNGKHHPLRQKGKTAELACIAEGQLVETDYGLVPIEEVAPYMLVYDGKEFVKHGGVVYQGIKEVISYGNLTATKDHIVFTEDGTCQFGDAARSKACLLQSRPNRKNLRVCGDYISRTSVYKKQMERVLCQYSVHKLSPRSMDLPRKSTEWEEQRMPEMQQASESPTVAIKTSYRHGSEMQQHTKRKLPQLRWEGYQIQIQHNLGRSLMDYGQFGVEETLGIRQDKQRRTLRTGEFEVRYEGNPTAEQTRLQSYRRGGGVGEDEESLPIKHDFTNATRYVGYAEDHRFSQAGRSGETKELEGYQSEPRKARTYDILNCGPRNRFVVSGVIVHNCGYRGGVGAMIKMGALKEGLTEKELPEIVKAWREASPKIVGLWKQCETAAKSAIKFPTREFTFGVGCSFYTKKISGERFLFMSLPSKRLIAYPRPDIKQQLVWQEVKKVKTPEGVKVEKGDWKKLLTPTESQVQKIMAIYPEARITDVITFHGKIPNSAHWGTISTHGGVFVENCIQGIAADFMAHGAINAESKGYEIVALIHDEALAHYYPEKGQSLEEFTKLLVALPDWAEGMPLSADGDIVKFYKK